MIRTTAATALAVALLLAPAKAQSFLYYPDDNTGASYSAPAGWYPWYTNTTGSRLQILVPASAFSGFPGGVLTSIGSYLGNSVPAGAASVTFSIFQVRIGPAAVPALTNTYAANLLPGTETLVIDAPGVTLPVNAAGSWQDVPFTAPWVYPGGDLIVDFQTQIPAGGPYFHSTVSSAVPRCVSATYTGQTTGTLGASSGTKVRFGYNPENILTATTSGMGTGDLSLSLTSITWGYTEGYVLFTDSAAGQPGSGPFFGLWPTAMTWTILGVPASPGNPLHFLAGFPSFFPDATFTVGAGTLSSLAGQTWDAAAVVLGAGFTYLGRSNVQRLNW